MFFTQSFRRNRNINAMFSDKEGDFFVLTKDTWNDHGFETTFWLDFWENGEFFEIGLVRILNIKNDITRHVIPENFDKLTEEYISLGYNEEFYENIIKVIGKEGSKEILRNLRDISIIGLKDNKYFNLEYKGIQDSFFRSSEGRFLFYEVHNKYFLDEESQDRDYNFTFKSQIYLNSEEVKNIEIDFRKKDRFLPNRLFTIVGKNGVGKTRFLNQLAESLFDSSKLENKNRFIIEEQEKNEETENVPIYNKIIAISFSVFDKFYKGSKEERNISKENTQSEEEKTKFNNYTYIGLHKVDNTTYTTEELNDINKRAYKKILDKDRSEMFISLINSSNILHYKLDNNLDYDSFFNTIFSSGQSIYISMICRLLSEIEDGSLIFLDEPELYLHPNAISNLARVYYEILEEFKSYAILCTHSPILVQEIPSKFVRKLSIVDTNTISYTRPNIETFGANISEITADIFNVLDSESLYKSKIKYWVLNNEISEDEILKLFDNGLSFKTQLYINSLFKENN